MHAAEGGWSKVVEGVRGRLIVTAVDGKQRQLRVELELENTTDRAAPIPIFWGPLGSMLKLGLDDGGKDVEQNHIGGNDLGLNPYTLLLPVASHLRILISPSAFEYVPNGRVMLRPVSLQAWDIPPSHGKLSLRATLTPSPSKERNHWKGPLELPPVSLP